MTEAEKKEKTRKNVRRVWDGSKLIMAIGALTAAINAYANLKAESVELSEQNALAFQALASKVNGMAERMAYMQGRLDGLTEAEAEDAVELKIEEFDPVEEVEDAMKSMRREKARRPASIKPAAGVGVTAPDMASDEEDSVAEVVVVDDVAMVEDLPNLMRAQRYIQIDAYEQLPEDLEELIDVREQIQEQAQEEQ